jgi:hypothetical protein
MICDRSCSIFDYLQAKLFAIDPYALIADYDYLADDEELRVIGLTSLSPRCVLGEWPPRRSACFLSLQPRTGIISQPRQC